MPDNNVLKAEGSNYGANQNKFTVLRSSQMPEFEPNTHKWSEWKERLEVHFAEIGCADDDDSAKKSTLLKSICAECYSLLHAVCHPIVPVKKTYKELCQLLETHYSPPVIVFRERLNFYLATKNSSESVTAWYARVKMLAVKCKFAHLDDSVRDKFACGMASEEKIFDKLCEEDESLTLADALKKALIQETKINAKSAYGTQATAEVNFVRHGSSNGTKGKGQPKKKCKHCGWTNHEAATCKFKQATCNSCSKVGHLASICRSKDKKKNNSVNSIGISTNGNNFTNNSSNFSHFSPTFSSEFDDKYGIYHITAGQASRSFGLTVDINGKQFDTKCDTGAPCCLMSGSTFDKFFDRELLKPSRQPFFDYGGHSIGIVGEFFATVTYRGHTATVCFIITNKDRPTLLGESFLDAFNFRLIQVSSVNNISAASFEHIVSQIKSDFSDVFKRELGTYKDCVVNLPIIDGAKPIFCKPRPVPFAWKSKVEKQLKDLVDRGVLEPVDNSDWGTPLVPVLKPTGEIRLCGDYKTTVNKFLVDFKYPLPRIEEIFASLQGGTQFTKLDLSNAYNQLVLDEQSQLLCTWSTHLGVFKMKRLPFGVKTAAAIFQKTIENLLRGIPNCMNFMDDIVVTGKDFKSHIDTLKKVLAKLQSAGLRLNPDKCVFFQDRISYLGFDIDRNGLSKNSRHVESVLNAPDPGDVHEVRAFIGMVNFYSQFIPNFAEKMEPLYELLRKGIQFNFSSACRAAYELLKRELTSNRVLVHFDPKKPIVLTTDACNTAVAGVLSHKFPDGSLRPIAFVSRALTKAERNYSTIQKEALAIVFSVIKLHQYLMGIKFELHTDHKPLLSIFGENNGLPVMAAARMQRWAFLLSGFDYTIKYVKGVSNHADFLSRFPQNEPNENFDGATYINYVDFDNVLQLNFQNIAIETRRDPVLAKLSDAIQNGTVAQLVGDQFKPFLNKQSELSVESGCILWGYRTIVPSRQRQQILQDLHRSHLGIVKTKALARSYVWWPKLDHDIELMIKQCVPCNLTQSSPEKSSLIPWQPTSHAWSRVHIDFLGPIKGFHFLIVIDSYSKWVEIFKTKTMTTSFVVDKLRETFSRFGLIDTLVSDNGRQFTSDEFEKFLQANRIKHVLTAPGHPATNGQAENFVRTFKKSIYANLKEERADQFDIIIARFLIDYRNMKHCTTGDSPAKILFGRELKTRFSLLKPPTTQEKILDSQQTAIKNARGKRNCQFNVGQKVYVRDYTDPNKAAWTEAIIEKSYGPRNYSCKLAKNDRQIKRHLNQIRTANQDWIVSDNSADDSVQEANRPQGASIPIHDDRVHVDSTSETAEREMSSVVAAETTANVTKTKTMNRDDLMEFSFDSEGEANGPPSRIYQVFDMVRNVFYVK